MRRPAAKPALPALPALLAVALFALAACAKPSVRIEESQTFRDATWSHSVEAAVASEVKNLSLDLDLEVTQGTVRFQAIDSVGATRWQGEVGAGGTLADSRTWPSPPTGQWRLELTMLGASGTYSAKWLGK